MKLDGSYTFEAPQDIVWDALLDPVMLGAALPGSEGLEALGDDKYKAVLKVQVGPVQGVFEGTVALSKINKPDSYHMDIDGKGAPGFVKGGGDVRLEVQEGKTIMHYSGDAQVGGRIASVGQRLLESSAKALTRQSLDAIAEQIKVRVEARKAHDVAVAAAALKAEASPPPPPPAPTVIKPPSRVKFTLGVMGGVFADLIPAPYRPVVIGTAVIILVLIIYALARAIFH